MPNLASPLIVIADDDRQFLEVMAFHLGKWSYRVKCATDKADLYRLLCEEEPAMLLMDVQFGVHDGVEILQQLLQARPHLNVLMLTAYGSIDSAVTAIKFGAKDYLTKPVDMTRLRSAMDAAMVDRTAEIRPTRSSEPVIGGLARPILGESPAMRSVLGRISSAAPTDATVLILGETGTGKELIARAVHELSPRAAGPFVAINVAALPRELLESTLFGHEKGAFTGADKIQRGCCEAAHNGTLFLDEIGDMEPGLQAKLLRFLQERSFFRVGSSQPISVDLRIIAATNTNLPDQIKHGQFREDLYYRLNVVPILLPPLRERREDIPLLANRFLDKFSARYRKTTAGFTPEALEILSRFDWPGNVRQLENLIERIAIFSSDQPVEAAMVEHELRATRSSASWLAPDIAASPPGGMFTSIPNPRPDESLRAMDQIEKQAIIDALKESGGSVREAARILGLGQATVYRKIKRYGIPL